MIDRVLEPEVMGSPEEARAYDTMDHAAVNTQFVRDLVETGYPIGGSVLDVGTGTARIPIMLCREIADVAVVGIDLSEQMLLLANVNIKEAGFSSRIQAANQDAKQLPFDDQQFDLVISNSIAHHIPRPAQVLAEAVRVTRDGGFLFWRDLVRPESDERLCSLVQLYAGDENDQQQRLFSESLRAALNLEEIRAMVEKLGFDSATVCLTSDRHWTWSARKASGTPGDRIDQG